jgi:hypothetical protein
MKLVTTLVQKLTSKTRWAAVMIGVIAFLQASGIHVDPLWLKVAAAVGMWGGRDAIDKLQSDR